MFFFVFVCMDFYNIGEIVRLLFFSIIVILLMRIFGFLKFVKYMIRSSMKFISYYFEIWLGLYFLYSLLLIFVLGFVLYFFINRENE